jgi:DNA repair photolyase
MIQEIQAKTMLARVKGDDDWFGLYYNMNLYRGCQHQCIYCDSRSECYQIGNFNTEVLVKANAIELLRRELASKRLVGTIGTGSMHDPYMPLEKEFRLTHQALKTIADFGFPVHTITKSDLVLRDLDLFAAIQEQTHAAITFTITTADDDLSRKLEPGAPVSSRRFAALQDLSRRGILTGITMMPVLPFIEDTEENIHQIVTLAAGHGARYILPSFGMTLRDRQRTFFYAKLDREFSGIRLRYEKAFGERYFASAQNGSKLMDVFTGLCSHHGIDKRIPKFTPRKRLQRDNLRPRLFD